jgi:hypothetical protein
MSLVSIEPASQMSDVWLALGDRGFLLVCVDAGAGEAWKRPTAMTPEDGSVLIEFADETEVAWAADTLVTFVAILEPVLMREHWSPPPCDAES